MRIYDHIICGARLPRWRLGGDDLDDADAEAAVDGHDLAAGDERAVGHDVEQLVRLAVELDDAAFGKLHQLGELQRGAADLDRQADRDVGEQAEIAAAEGSSSAGPASMMS